MFEALQNLFGFGEKIENYKKMSPSLKIQEYFNGELKAWGLLKDYKGQVSRRFTVSMQGSWKKKEGKLQEYFVFDDGEKQERTWAFTFQDEENFFGTAHDVVGQAEGRQIGNTVNMKYVMQIPVGAKTYDIFIDDYLYRLDERRVLNISKLKKFGITVGSLFIYFEKD